MYALSSFELTIVFYTTIVGIKANANDFSLFLGDLTEKVISWINTKPKYDRQNKEAIKGLSTETLGSILGFHFM